MTELWTAYDLARRTLLAERTADGHWAGRLSSSALSTATAVTALAAVRCSDRQECLSPLVEAGARWLATHQNADGGWGDTPDSPSNLATTMLACSALAQAGSDVRDVPRATAGYLDPLGIMTGTGDAHHPAAGYQDPLGIAAARAEEYLTRAAGATPEERVQAIREAYGEDRTFSVPILADLAIAGMVDWRDVPALPFELARLPRALFRFLRLHVVSYALPALIAIGQAIHAKNPSRCPLTRRLRNHSIEPTLALLERIQPASGGYLEATPLTSFVVMSLAAAGRADHAVARRGAEFLVAGAREDGSWPIDTNLATWLTTQAVEALGDDLPADAGPPIRDWLLAQQHRARHAYTDSPPGAWAWTDLSGGVPDADDTAGALLALARLGVGADDERMREAVRWLLDLQNSDGGWPTFCRGWGKLPFDRSAPDLTAHAIRALTRCAGDLPRARWAVARAFDYLRRSQRADGSWAPLWFGNQSVPGMANPAYGTSRVLAAYAEVRPEAPEAARAAAWLVSAQNSDGGWGGAAGVASTVEETALAACALAERNEPEALAAARRGGEYLAQSILRKGLAHPAPIGLYFSVLWYSERLYPAIWSVGALRALLRRDA